MIYFSNMDTKLIKDTLTDNSSWFSILGLIVLGAGAIIGLICIGDYIAPSIIRGIPGIETILDSIYSVGNNIISWFTSIDKNNPDLPKSPDSINIPETISRSSSGSSSSSTSTITPPTPPVSRTSTPMPPIGMFWD
jgi:hypothetical protein